MSRPTDRTKPRTSSHRLFWPKDHFERFSDDRIPDPFYHAAYAAGTSMTVYLLQHLSLIVIARCFFSSSIPSTISETSETLCILLPVGYLLANLAMFALVSAAVPKSQSLFSVSSSRL